MKKIILASVVFVLICCCAKTFGMNNQKNEFIILCVKESSEKIKKYFSIIEKKTLPKPKCIVRDSVRLLDDNDDDDVIEAEKYRTFFCIGLEKILEFNNCNASFNQAKKFDTCLKKLKDVFIKLSKKSLLPNKTKVEKKYEKLVEKIMKLQVDLDKCQVEPTPKPKIKPESLIVGYSVFR